MPLKKMLYAALFVAAGVLTGPIVSIPVGVSRCFPVQHTINVLSAVLLGPAYALLNAFSISLLRNLLGTGTLLAFPGSLFGAVLAGLFYRLFRRNIAAAAGEVLGTGFLGGLAAFPTALLLMGKTTGAFFFIPPFLISTAGGSLLALLLLPLLQRALPSKDPGGRL
ncbi:energy coupling factor transporter S component ThiW [Candidatus Mcinerneyibacteriota bacterium]|nr:energy coupling factor transporter S component ThiW [Candidatus Mcinerneyibacteriota bacterium]